MPSDQGAGMIPVERATAGDLAPLSEQLAAAGLPLAGFAALVDTMLVARGPDGALGCVALEFYEREALLRSLVVSASARGLGLGERLAAAALALARERGARRVWLLTTTAESFFPRFGFRSVERSSLPAALGESAELRGACPDSAVAMALEL